MTEKHDLLPATMDTLNEETTESRRSSKKLSRQNSLEEYIEPKKKKMCPDYFGVRSYLHHFYDSSSFKDPHIYEDESTMYLLPGRHPHSRRCRSLWWKIFTWVGVNMLVFGTVGILVGYLVPQKAVVVSTDKVDRIVTIDRGAISHNYLLDLCKMIGLVLFSVGGFTLALALLFPSFLSKYCDDDMYVSEENASILVRYGDKTSPMTPVEFVTMPASTEVASVQPTRKDDSFVTKEGMVKFKD